MNDRKRKASESDVRPPTVEPVIVKSAAAKSAIVRLAIVVAGILFGQVLLYGPCLIGQRILLPLDILAQRDVYLPNTVDIFGKQAYDITLSDLVYAEEPARHFASSELHAGRLPMWAPHQFAGAPFVWPIFSPYSLLKCSAESPLILAWAQVAAALVAGLGIYLFLRRAAEVGFLIAGDDLLPGGGREERWVEARLLFHEFGMIQLPLGRKNRRGAVVADPYPYPK
jgi:hypothetical protein